MPHAFEALGGVARRLPYDNMKTVVLERDVGGTGERRDHAGFLDYAKHSGFVIKLSRARTKGKVERFNGDPRRSFYVPLISRLKQAGLHLDVVTANAEVRRWLKDVANARLHGSPHVSPTQRLQEEQAHLQGIPLPRRGDIAAARPFGATPPPDGGRENRLANANANANANASAASAHRLRTAPEATAACRGDHAMNLQYERMLALRESLNLPFILKISVGDVRAAGNAGRL